LPFIKEHFDCASSIRPDGLELSHFLMADPGRPKEVTEGSYVWNDEGTGVLGSGSFGEAYKVQNRQSAHYDVVRRIDTAPLSGALRSEFIPTLDKLATIKYGFLASIRGYSLHDPHLLAYDYFDWTLERLLGLSKPPSWFDATTRTSIAAGIVSAVCFLHEEKVLHGNLKPSNIFLEKRAASLIPRVAEYGLAKFMTADRSEDHYFANDRKLTAKSDVYSIGMVLQDLLGSAKSKRFRAVIQECTDPDPTKRPTAMEVFAKFTRSDDPLQFFGTEEERFKSFLDLAETEWNRCRQRPFRSL
jgi:serine/threonine protein kinase